VETEHKEHRRKRQAQQKKNLQGTHTIASPCCFPLTREDHKEEEERYEQWVRCKLLPQPLH
jgi:hypothetical protein